MNAPKCIKCGEQMEYIEKVFNNGTKHKEMKCMGCDRSGGFVKSTQDEDFKLPFGKYKGKLLLDIAKEDKDYLEWLLKEGNLQNNLKKRVMTALGKKIKEKKLLNKDELKERLTKNIKFMLHILNSKQIDITDIPANIRKALLKYIEKSFEEKDK